MRTHLHVKDFSKKELQTFSKTQLMERASFLNSERKFFEKNAEYWSMKLYQCNPFEKSFQKHIRQKLRNHFFQYVREVKSLHRKTKQQLQKKLSEANQ